MKGDRASDGRSPHPRPLSRGERGGSASDGDHAGRTAWRWATVPLLWVLYAQLILAATRLSVTVDEGFHITSGYEALRTGRVRLFDEHPPLVKALLAWPLLFVPDLQVPESAIGYDRGDLIAVAQQTVLAYRPLDRVIVGPRVAAALLTVLLAASISGAARRLGGIKAGLPALFVCVFDPNFVAHGSLATTDMGATMFIFWAVWAGGLWVAHPTRRGTAFAALSLGLAQGAKLTALLLYPVVGAAWLVDVVRGSVLSSHAAGEKGLGSVGHSGPKLEVLQRMRGLAGIVAGSFLVLWALYSFEVAPVEGLLGGAVPLPAASHLERWLRLQENIAYGREAFLLGQNRMHGWSLYFPIAFLTKTPLPLLALLGWGCVLWGVSLVHRRGGSTARSGRPGFVSLALFPVLYALASLTSTLNIGYRHLLPVLPFVYLGVAIPIGRCLDSSGTQSLVRTWSRVILGLLGVWMAAATLRIAPHGLAFFNELAGGPANGRRFLADSNTDWGQTFKALAAYQQETSIKPVKLSSFIFYDPGAYGVVYEPIAPMTGAPPVMPQRLSPAPGVYAISATTLDGVPLADPWTYAWFRYREPLARIGHAMFIYEVAPSSGSWVAQCSLPVAPLTDAVIVEGLGDPELRRLTFDCEKSWVLPGGAASGWYVRAIREETQLRWPRPDDQRLDLLPSWVPNAVPGCLGLSYLQSRHGVSPAFAMWEGVGCEMPASRPPVALGDVVAFLGFVAPERAAPGAVIQVLTLWEIRAVPERPVSLMLHLLGADGALIAVGDDLGYPQQQWRDGDQLIQLHTLAIPEATAPGACVLRTGAYSLDTLEPVGDMPTLPFVLE